ncbi:MAG: hypothetical protein HC817_16370 [Saprospiraceae bacterium]|nr:hypothetical protein [Saprospiraceae bacterium]
MSSSAVKKLKLDAKEFELQKTAQGNLEIQRLLKELKNEKSFDATAEEILHTIEKADHNPNIPFRYSKPQALLVLVCSRKSKPNSHSAKPKQTNGKA